jgi:hypothetical protein
MSLFSLRSCDCAGSVLDDRHVDARNLDAALAHANRQARRMADDGWMNPGGRIDVLDSEGRTVARLHCAEAIAAMSLVCAAEIVHQPRQRRTAQW